jgi:hypothetical protein
MRAAVSIFVAVVFVLIVVASVKLYIDPDPIPQELSCSR